MKSNEKINDYDKNRDYPDYGASNFDASHSNDQTNTLQKTGEVERRKEGEPYQLSTRRIKAYNFCLMIKSL